MATVEFNSKDDVREAINKFDCYEYRGREIFVRQDYPPPEKKHDYGPPRGRGTTYDSRSGVEIDTMTDIKAVEEMTIMLLLHHQANQVQKFLLVICHSR